LHVQAGYPDLGGPKINAAMTKKMKAHFEFDTSKVSRINVKYHSGKWYVNLTSEIQEAELVDIVKKVGIDVGLLTFAALFRRSENRKPQVLQKIRREISQVAEAAFSQRKKVQNNRGKAKAKSD